MSSSEPHCATHPDAVAVATCARCGTFVCAACLPGAGTVCAACVGRAQVQGELPLWERYQEARVPLPIAFGRTVVEVIFEPSAFFSRVANGRGLKAPLLLAWPSR